MSTQNPSNLYRGNAVVFDSKPYIAFAIRQQAVRKAKDEALDRYFGDQMSKITPTGMRQQEIEPLLAAKGDFQRYWMENKNAIKNPSADNGKAYAEMQNKLNTMQGLMAGSKSELESTKVFGDIKAKQPDLVDRMDENTFRSIESSAHPIAKFENGQLVPNENFKHFDSNAISYNPKMWETKEWQGYTDKLGKFIAPDKNITETRVNPNDPYSAITSTVAERSPAKKQQLVATAIDDYNNDKELQYSFNKSHSLLNTDVTEWKDEHMKDFAELNNAFKNVTGKDVETPAELHAATMLSYLDEPTVSEKQGVNKQAVMDKAFAQKLKAMGYNDYLIKGRMKTQQGYRKAIIDYKSAVSKQEQEGVLNNFIKNSYDAGVNTITETVNGKSQTLPIQGVYIGGNLYKGKVIDVPLSIKNKYAVPAVDENGAIIKDKFEVPNSFMITDDKKKFIPLFLDEKVKDKNSFYLKSKLSKPVDIQFYKLDIGKELLSKGDIGSEVVDEFAGDEQGNFIPELKTTVREGTKRTESRSISAPILKGNVR